MLRLLVLTLDFLAATPASADVTAHYRSGTTETMVVLLADNGDLLIEHGPGTSYLTTGGETYLILADPRGTFTTRRETFLAALRALSGNAPPPARPEHYSILDDGEENVGGFAGRRLSVGTEGSRQDRMDVVVTTAPELRAVGRAIAGHIEPWLSAVPGTSPELARTFRTALEQGALLRLGPLFAFERLDPSPIPAARFRLPSPPLDQEALTARLLESAGR
jgi:hypothetical protein